MKTLTLAVFPIALLVGCHGAFWGNLMVLGITVGIFVGTLSLGRSTDATRSDGAAPTSSTTGGS